MKKEIENQPGLKNSYLNLIMTCNITKVETFRGFSEMWGQVGLGGSV